MTKTDFQTEIQTRGLVRDYWQMRFGIAFFGVLLPIVPLVWAFGWEGCLRFSVSAYYHADHPVVHWAFVGCLTAVGMFLIVYRGYRAGPGERLTDNLVTNLGGLAAIGVAAFPTAEKHFTPDAAGALQCLAEYCTEGCVSDKGARMHFHIAHLVAAIVFFSTMIYMCLRMFTRSELQAPEVPGAPPRRALIERGSHKFWRNRFYRACAAVIAVSIVLIAIEVFLANPQTRRDWAPAWFGAHWPTRHLAAPVFWFEACAIWAFGLAWLVKSRVLMSGRP